MKTTTRRPLTAFEGWFDNTMCDIAFTLHIDSEQDMATACAKQLALWCELNGANFHQAVLAAYRPAVETVTAPAANDGKEREAA